MKITQTHRGFSLIEMHDSNGNRYDLQDSSAAEDNFMWIFYIDKNTDERVENFAIHLNKKDAEKLKRILERFVSTGSIA